MPTSANAIFYRRVSLLTCAGALAVLLCEPAGAQQASNGNQDKHLDISSSAGDLHIGNDADVRDIGLPLYPGARLRHDDDGDNSANLAFFTASFGMKLLVANYQANDPPDKLIASIATS